MLVLIIGGTGSFSSRVTECIAQVLSVGLKLHAVPSNIFRQFIDTPPQFNWHRPYSRAKAVARLGYLPVGTPRVMLEETVRHILDHGMVNGCAERPYADDVIELLQRHEAELGGWLAIKNNRRA